MPRRGLILVDTSGDLRVVASSSEQMRTLELLELQSSEGPCLDAFPHSLRAGGADDLDEVKRWPNFATHVRLAGYRSIYAVPMLPSLKYHRAPQLVHYGSSDVVRR